MIPLLLILALFFAWSLVGVGILSVARADLGCLRVLLAAPALGTAAMVLPLFVLSEAGVAMEDGARPVAIVLLAASVVAVAVRRPRLTPAMLPVLAIGVGGVVLAGWPMFEFGFNWIANANDDMANYVLSATQTLHAGLLAAPNIAELSRGRNYPSLLQQLHAAGARPGSDVALGAVAGVVDRPVYQLFMPVILAFQLCAICGTAALALQGSTRRWVPIVAAGLVAVAPLWTFGVVQQLMPQVWGLALATSLLALLMRKELHRDSGAHVRDIVPIVLIFSALALVYIELAATIVFAYALFLVVLAVRRQLSVRAALRIWVPGVVVLALVLNSYAIRELRFLRGQASFGVGGQFGGPPNFGFTLVPDALPGILGLQLMPIPGGTRHVNLWIAVAVLLLAGIVCAAIWSALRGVAASIAVVVYGVLGLYLGLKSSDFGLYKLYMYVQPFLAASIAVWLASAGRRLLAVLVVPLALLVALQVHRQHEYVFESIDPGGLRHASAADLLPAFSRFAKVSGPIVTVTDNPTLGKLEAANDLGQPVEFMSQNLFAPFTPPRLARATGWIPRSFTFTVDGKRRSDAFLENVHASAALTSARCTLVLPTSEQSVFNLRSLPAAPDLTAMPCRAARNLLVFVASRLGWGYYDFYRRSKVALYPVQDDFFYPGETMSGFGADVLLRAVRPSRGVRLVLDFTTTYIHNGSNSLPPVSVIGGRRVALPLEGRGSARVFSAPLEPKVIAGQPYFLLDTGRSGALQPEFRPGLAGLYGNSIPLDPRILTSYVHEVSLVSAAQYRRLRPPTALAGFPKALADPDLAYSGLYEDGWVGENSYVVLAGGRPADLVLRAEVPVVPGGQHLQVLVDGQTVVDRVVAPGHLQVRVPVRSSRSNRRIELRWASAPRLPEPDGRPAAALLRFLGLVPRASR